LIPKDLDGLKGSGADWLERFKPYIEEENEHRWCPWPPDLAGYDSRSIFERAPVEK
jgi:hypothetical protein